MFVYKTVTLRPHDLIVAVYTMERERGDEGGSVHTTWIVLPLKLYSEKYKKKIRRRNT
jgi:hypothetical protein